MGEIAFESAVQLAAAIRTKRIGSGEVLDHYVQRVERLNPKINAVVTLDLDRARQRADAADAALVRGEVWGPLHGVPPSFGIVPFRGHIPGPPGTLSETDIAVAGPLGRGADDLARLAARK